MLCLSVELPTPCGRRGKRDAGDYVLGKLIETGERILKRGWLSRFHFGSQLQQDDEAELLAELERIKKERAEEAAKKAKAEEEAAKVEKRNEVARGNPLLNPTSFTVKRRWDDDVVFRNQVTIPAKDLRYVCQYVTSR